MKIASGHSSVVLMFVRERDCLISKADRVYIETLMICLHCLRAHTVADCVLSFDAEEEA